MTDIADAMRVPAGSHGPETDAPVIACHDCGLFYRAAAVPVGHQAKCSRCGATLYRASHGSISQSLHFALAALVLLILANSFPFMSFEMEGREEASSLFSGVRTLYNDGLWPLAVLVFATSILFPFAKTSGTLYVLLPLRFGYRLPGAQSVFRIIELLHPWAMLEVYLLGLFVAYVNLSGIGQLEFGVAAYSFAALVVVMAAGDAALEPREVWEKFGASASLSVLPLPGDRSFVGCRSCDQVSRMARPPRGGRAHCGRCGAALFHRKPNSRARTWALVLTAAIFYVPANTYPMMTVISFGKGQPDTILSGIRHLIQGGYWPLAALVFFASFMVPLIKLAGLSYLLITVQRRSTSRMRDRTVLFRLIEGVGRWSMIDIFMISILVGLVKLGQIATIEPGVGATSFAAMVIITMIAAYTFDPRLIWDAADREGDRRDE